MVNSIVKAFEILEVIKEIGNKAKLKEICLALNQKAPTVHNILKTLIVIGYVEKENEEYSVSKKIINNFKILFNKKDVLKIANSLMESLSESVEENVVLAIIKNGKKEILKEVACTQSIIVNPTKNTNNSLYITSIGRMLFAGMSDIEKNKYILENGLPGQEWNNLNTNKKLNNEIENILEKGIVEYISSDKKVHSFACPIYNSEKKMIACLGVYCPTIRIRDRNKQLIINELKKTSTMLSNKYQKKFNQ